MKPANYNFEIYQAKDFIKSFAWSTKTNGIITPVNIAGYHISWKIVPIGINLQAIEWTDTGVNPVFIVDVTNNKFLLEVPNSVTKDYNFNNAVHELNIISPTGIIYPFLTGTCKLIKEL